MTVKVQLKKKRLVISLKKLQAKVTVVAQKLRM
jgi:hypothetical protein